MLINKEICFLRGSLPQIQTQRGQPPASIDSKGWEMSKVREKSEKTLRFSYSFYEPACGITFFKQSQQTVNKQISEKRK